MSRDDLISAEDAVEDNKEELLNNEVPETEEVEQEEAEIEENSEPEVQKAKKYGHLSKEEWIAAGRDPNLWKSPEQFNKTGEVIDQLNSLRKKIDQRDREIQALVEYQKRTAQREYEKAKQDLEQRLAASKDDMDMEAVSHYTKELTRLEDMEQQNQVQTQRQSVIDAEARFMERNQHWYNERNADLVQQAHSISNELRQIYPNATPDELAQKIELRMQYEHPERVGNQHKVRPSVSPSVSSVNKTAVVKKHSIKNLSDEHKALYNMYKRISPNATEAGFIQKLKDDGEL